MHRSRFNFKAKEIMNIQEEICKIHSQFGTTEMANYQMQLLFDKAQKSSYNQAIDDAANSEECDFTMEDEKETICNSIEWIKNLKKP